MGGLSSVGGALIVAATALSACSGGHAATTVHDDRLVSPPATEHLEEPPGVVTLAFAGDIHFQLHLAALLEHPRGALGPIARTLGAADLTMVNLESAITRGGTPDPKVLEDPEDRYYFRTTPAALDLLAAAGVDVVTVANNHAADYGSTGLSDTLEAVDRSPIPVVGIGRNREVAFTPYRVSVQGNDLAFFAADSSARESTEPGWSAGASSPGIAAARAARPRALLRAVRAASAVDDIVVVYLHWGAPMESCPTDRQRTLARALAGAGADVIVGTHAHVPLGAGWMGGAYVSYGLGNFLWYHNHQADTGVLTVRIRGGEVVDDSWAPAVIGTWGVPRPLAGAQRAEAIEDWTALRGCSGLSGPTGRYTAGVSRIGPELRARMRWSHHAGCPLRWAELRHLQLTYVGFDGLDHTGELVVHRDHVAAMTEVFRRLYDARWPIRQMRLVDDFGGSDRRSMAADNTSAYNCRRVAGSSQWSDHAFGAAVDINPAENPYLTAAGVQPRRAARFAALDRWSDATLPRGVIGRYGVVARAFAAVGWTWGGDWSVTPDFQHFSGRRDR